jgi:hypothetical protein
LNPEKTASSKKRKAESILSTEINLTTSSDEDKQQEYLLLLLNPLSLGELSYQHLTQQISTELVVSLIVNNEEHLLRALFDTGASSSSILEAYNSAPLIKTVIQPPGLQWVVSLLKLKLGYACDIFTPRVQFQATNVFFLEISCR